jgi:hypothetical protein
MAETIFEALLLSWPIFLGLTVWLAKPAAAIGLVERCNQWLNKTAPRWCPS